MPNSHTTVKVFLNPIPRLETLLPYMPHCKGRQIEHLIQSKGSGIQLNAQSMRWLENIPDKLRLFLVNIGLVDEQRAAADKPLAQHLRDFRQSLQDKGNTDQHCKLVTMRTERVITGCKFVNWSDISASKVQRYLADLRSTGDRPSECQASII